MKNALTFSFLILSFSMFSQNKLLEKLDVHEQHYSDNDSTRIYSLHGFDSLKIVTHIRTTEYFVGADTLHRDYIQAGSNHFVLDKILGLKSSDYTVAYDLLHLYSIRVDSIVYLIFEGVDGFPMGTDQQVCYVIMKLEKGNWFFHSTYDNDHNMPVAGIKVIVSGKEIRLKGKYLRRILP